MRADIIITDFKANVKTWLRSKGVLFWTLAFPIILILIFGAIFSGTDDFSYTLYIQDQDDSTYSQTLIGILNQTEIFELETIDPSVEILGYIEENNAKRVLQIPSGYGNQVTSSIANPSVNATITYYFDQTETSTNQIARGIISDVIQNLNMQYTGAHSVITIKDEPTVTGDFSFIDFFLPGMIGFTIMQTCIYGSIERNTKYRKDGILRKLQTMPITRMEWIFSKMLFQLFLSFVTASVIILVGMLVWGITVHLDLFFILLIIANSLLFTGMGMVISRFVKEEETADTAGGAITFPMMFLAGTFFPLEQMPEALQTIAKILPLYYVNEGLRNAMIYLDADKTLQNTVISLAFALVFFISGVLLTKWKED